jgi:hypothetical protein
VMTGIVVLVRSILPIVLLSFVSDSTALETFASG